MSLHTRLVMKIIGVIILIAFVCCLCMTPKKFENKLDDLVKKSKDGNISYSTNNKLMNTNKRAYNPFKTSCIVDAIILFIFAIGVLVLSEFVIMCVFLGFAILCLIMYKLLKNMDIRYSLWII